MKIIITGGAGFIGCNAAHRYLKKGHDVVVADNLSRVGAEKNLVCLREQGAFEFVHVDVRDAGGVARLFARHADAERVLHLAAQVAVTTSVTDPRLDFEVNALGTFNVLEGLRLAGSRALIIYSSTNKVYGEMNDLEVTERDGRYEYANLPCGVTEDRALDFHSPYGCSKGAADQYTIDYHRIYGLRTVVFRQSCIYGYRQFGAEDQGWVAWFMIATQAGRPVTIYGDGKQVRDILFIDDLLDAYDAAFNGGDAAVGRAYNIGGGPGNVLSLRQLVAFLDRRQNRSIGPSLAEWRPGDQKVFVADIRRAQRELGWSPKTGCAQGLDQLYTWIEANRVLFQ